MRKGRKYEYNGKKYTMSELSKMSIRLSYSTLFHRIVNKGWDIEMAIKTPLCVKLSKYVKPTEEEKRYWNNLKLDDEYKEKFVNKPIIGDISGFL